MLSLCLIRASGLEDLTQRFGLYQEHALQVPAAVLLSCLITLSLVGSFLCLPLSLIVSSSFLLAARFLFSTSLTRALLLLTTIFIIVHRAPFPLKKPRSNTNLETRCLAVIEIVKRKSVSRALNRIQERAPSKARKIETVIFQKILVSNPVPVEYGCLSGF